MRQRSRRLLAIAVTLSAIAAVSGTGAFSALGTDRPAEIAVAADTDGASLELAPSGGSTSAFATDTEGDGTLELQFDGDAPGVAGQGLNPDAVTRLNDVVRITNQGTQPVAVWVDDGGVSAVTFSTDMESHGSLEGSSNAYRLDPGTSVVVDLSFDSTGTRAGTQLLQRVTVHASAAPKE